MTRRATSPAAGLDLAAGLSFTASHTGSGSGMANICPVCRCLIQPQFVSCPTCAQTKSREAYRLAQHDPIRKCAAGQAQLTTRAINNVCHLQMFGTYLTFCGKNVGDDNRRNYLDWEDLSQACAGCRIEVNRILEEACASA